MASLVNGSKTTTVNGAQPNPSSGPHSWQVEPALRCCRANPPPVLFADAKIPEDHVQNILDPNAPGQPFQRARGQPDVLGDQLLLAPRA
jgi:hypothetical protein